MSSPLDNAKSSEPIQVAQEHLDPGSGKGRGGGENRTYSWLKINREDFPILPLSPRLPRARVQMLLGACSLDRALSSSDIMDTQWNRLLPHLRSYCNSHVIIILQGRSTHLQTAESFAEPLQMSVDH